jgi:electron transfer flavoprotein beta subunit
VVSVTSELNQPRLPPLTAILKAARKPLSTWGPEDIAVSAGDVGAQAATFEELSNLAPAQQRKEIILEGSDIDATIAELLRALEQEGVLVS